MTSNDNAVFIREDVFNARMDAFMATIRLENEKLRNELNAKIDGVQSSLNAKIEGYQAQNEKQFSELRSEIAGTRSEIKVLSTRMDSIEHRMSDLQNSISWSFTLAAAFVAVVGIIITVFIAFAPSIWSFVKRKRRPELSRNEVKSLVAEQFTEAMKNYFATRTEAQGH